MIIENFEQALKLANEFLNTKERKNYYRFTAFCESFCEEQVFSNPLTDEEVDNLRALKEKYGTEFTQHLNEVYDDPDVIHDFTCGEELLDIDLDHIDHKFAFKIHELKPDGTVACYNRNVDLHDDEYAKLIAWHIYDVHFTLNTLRRRDRNLYDTIMRGIDHYYYQAEYFYLVNNPYLATPDEAKADAESIVALHNIKKSNGYITEMF